MKVEKTSLVAMLLEVGEENAAVLLARSPLPDEIDTTQDLDTLMEFGLDRDQIDEVARLAIGAIQPDDVNTRRRRGELAKTISRRWADLVDDWTSGGLIRRRGRFHWDTTLHAVGTEPRA